MRPHGGKRPGAGRKPLPDDQTRSKVFSVRVTESEHDTLMSADANQWARQTLLAAAKRRIKKDKR